MKAKSVVVTIIVLFLSTHSIMQADAFAQEDRPIRIFGYFQNSLQQWTSFEGFQKRSSFSLQQLNLFFQKDFGPNWNAFINFEFLNNFSSSRQWGSGNLEEAWIKYRTDMRFNLKLGLLLPIFNNLNEIKNRTPLLPYVIRPLAYETSLDEIVAIDLLTPTRAFAQVYGFFPSGEMKFDYAVYVGNSPNISNDPERGQTGVDTTATYLIGGRLGIRYGELKLGLSATYDKDSVFETLIDDFGLPTQGFNEIPKTRLGGDLSYRFANFMFEGEFIRADMHRDTPELNADLDFYYGTLGYHITERLLLYGTYWAMEERLAISTPGLEIAEGGEVDVYSLGASYALGDRISLKAQYARVKNPGETNRRGDNVVMTEGNDFTIFGLAASVYF